MKNVVNDSEFSHEAVLRDTVNCWCSPLEKFTFYGKDVKALYYNGCLVFIVTSDSNHIVDNRYLFSVVTQSMMDNLKVRKLPKGSTITLTVSEVA